LLSVLKWGQISNKLWRRVRLGKKYRWYGGYAVSLPLRQATRTRTMPHHLVCCKSVNLGSSAGHHAVLSPVLRTMAHCRYLIRVKWLKLGRKKVGPYMCARRQCGHWPNKFSASRRLAMYVARGALLCSDQDSPSTGVRFKSRTEVWGSTPSAGMEVFSYEDEVDVPTHGRGDVARAGTWGCGSCIDIETTNEICRCHGARTAVVDDTELTCT
jgi:hypothetical protein